jgi:ABC-2 type transport system ATP-binding protein
MSTAAESTISLVDVSKFYGEVLGINHVSVKIPAGLTGLVGPNGSGKSTLMNLLTGLLQPTGGEIRVLGISPQQPQDLFQHLGYCTQYDSFPAGATGLAFLLDTLALHGFERQESHERAWECLQQVGLEEAARRKIAGYSKGMRQRIKLAQAICHRPQVLILDEPLNGLDPMARAEIIDFMTKLAADGHHVIVSSHILHEVDVISDQVILIHGGSVVAEGEIRAVRGEIKNHPIQILIRCDRPHVIAAEAFGLDHVVEARILEEEGGLLVRTRNADAFFESLNRVVLDNELLIETVTPADETVDAVYGYLIGKNGASS